MLNLIASYIKDNKWLISILSIDKLQLKKRKLLILLSLQLSATLFKKIKAETLKKTKETLNKIKKVKKIKKTEERIYLKCTIILTLSELKLLLLKVSKKLKNLKKIFIKY